MIISKCLVCGSSSMRADRALSGRLVCNACGTPIGVRMRGNRKIRNSNSLFLKNKYYLIICIFILAFILVVI